MANITYTNTFVAGGTARASEVNANFADVTDQVNGNIEAANLATNAVTTAKITDLNVTTGKLADGAVTDAKVATGIDAAKLADGSVSNTELQYLDGVTSAIQTQFGTVNTALSARPVSYAGVVNDPDDAAGGAAGTTVLPSGWSVELPDGVETNAYTITHNLGDAAYVVVTTPIEGFVANDPYTFHLSERNANTCVLFAKAGASVGINVSFAFILQML